MTDPPALQLRALLRALHEHEVDFALFGGAAMVFYGFVRATEDVDIVVKPEHENLDRISDLLVELNAVLALRPRRAFGSRERWELQRGANATLITDLGRVDLVQRLEGLPPWEELAREMEVYELDGVPVCVMNRRTWIELKRRRGSPQDVADIAALRDLDEA